MLKQLGLAYDIIDVCPDGCMLFRGVGSEDWNHCFKCGKAQYKWVGKSLVPAKVLGYFPLIQRLQRMFSTFGQAKWMTWWAENRSRDEKIRYVCDGLLWKWIDANLGDFGASARNLRLALATDEVCPYGVKRSTYSTFPVMLLNYNIPPWLSTKKHFIMLSMIIPRKEAVTCETFDVYIQPLVEELYTLWVEGIWTEDTANYQGSRFFRMRAALMIFSRFSCLRHCRRLHDNRIHNLPHMWAWYNIEEISSSP